MQHCLDFSSHIIHCWRNLIYVAKACNFHTCALSHVRSLLSDDVAPDSHVQHRHFQAGLLQCAVEWRTGGDFRQTTACSEQPGQSSARSGVAPTASDARPLLHSLHWLPVRQRVTYKLAVLTNKVRTTATPTYLSELVQTHAPPRALHSSDAPTLVVPRIHTELAGRAFSVAAPSTWNSLTADIRLFKKILTFKCHLKTHLFKLT